MKYIISVDLQNFEISLQKSTLKKILKNIISPRKIPKKGKFFFPRKIIQKKKKSENKILSEIFLKFEKKSPFFCETNFKNLF